MFEAKQTRDLSGEEQTEGYSHTTVSRYQLFAPGELLLQRFRIVRLIGHGGMGEVYEAEDLELGVRVALKTIRSEITGNLELQSRFRREVQLALRVSHPSVCRIHALFALPGRPGRKDASSRLPTLFLTMEFLPGVTLAEKLQREGPFPWREVEATVEQICAGLGAIHADGIVHRDLKTRNIMLVEKNGSKRIVLMDFGLALESTVSDGSSRDGHNAPGVIVGTPDSMAPEQFDGRPVTPAADIYALGLVIYEMVTGKRPFAAATPLAAAALRGRRPERASSLRRDVPHGWDEVIDRCLAYEPAKRYSSAAQVIAALRLRDNPVGHLGVRIAQLAGRPLGWSLAAILLAAAALGIWYWRVQHDYHRPSAEVESWYEKGISAIREGTYVKATRALQMAEDKDSRFAMAHARLAEAWSELDFTGKAKDEMLEASTLEQQQHLPRLDDMYLHAVRATLTRDYPGAVREYQAILNELPAAQKADGYVDLGRATEKAGRIPAALADYETAARLAPDSPAAFVHIAILESRLQHRGEANTAFDKAEAIYRTEVNEEGLAEIAYQRGLAASTRGDTTEAKVHLDQSLQISKQISDVQIEIRALSQLSSVAYNADDDSVAAEYAKLAIQLAHDNSLEAWSADGLVCLGNSYLDARNSTELGRAEEPLKEGLTMAEQTQQQRVEAFANLGLASLRSQQHSPEQVIPYAQKALAYYSSHGFLTKASHASVLLVRAQRDSGDLLGALRSSTALLEVAKQAGESRIMFQAEDLTASVLRDLQRYPDALVHYQRALTLVRSNSDRLIEVQNCADVLWKLGFYSEARQDLREITNGKVMDSFSQLILVNMMISERRYADAWNLERQSLADHPDMSSDQMLEFRIAETLARLHVGVKTQAIKEANQIMVEMGASGDQGGIERANLLFAEVAVSSGNPLAGKHGAEEAVRYFETSGQQESELLGLYFLYKSQKYLGEDYGSISSAKKAIDILRGNEQSWSTPLYRSYVARPDIAAIYKELSHVSTGESP